jgi:hypothetical protein
MLPGSNPILSAEREGTAALGRSFKKDLSAKDKKID